MSSDQDRDRFGVPHRLLGPHDEDLYAVVGRVVLLSSLLEDRLRVVLSRLSAGVERPEPPSLHGVIVACQVHLPRVDNEAVREGLGRILEDADRCRELRNDLAHSLFPAQEDGTVFWWRERAGRVLTSVHASDPEQWRPTTMPGWALLVARVAELVEDADRLSWQVTPA